ncbi:hypothetical protein HT031_006537 [Scenedesmus sp. PABB004]|nr:hypothetical protein HT031_006537 [Scenedesmus sp. PABB004]
MERSGGGSARALAVALAAALALWCSAAAAAGAYTMAEPCKPGTFLDRGAGVCAPCTLPFFCPGGAVAPTPCSRTYPRDIVATRHKGARDAGDCRAAPGWELLQGGEPQECRVGWFKAGWNVKPCRSCGVGFLTDGGAASHRACSFPPGTGTVLVGGEMMVLPCRNGTYGRVTSTHSRKQVVACIPCPLNMVTADQVPGASPGSALPNAGPKACLVEPGYFVDGKRGTAAPCPKGSFSAGYNSARRCTACPAGTTTKVQGAASANECTPEATAPVLPPGYGSASGNAIQACAKGFWSPGGVGVNCTACPAGSTTPGTTSSSLSQCSLCLLGYGDLLPAGAGCTLCAINSYNDAEQAGACKHCPASFVSPAGSTALEQCAQEAQTLSGRDINSTNIPVTPIPAASTAADCTAACVASAKCIFARFGTSGWCELLLESAPATSPSKLFIPSYVSAGTAQSGRRLRAARPASSPTLLGAVFSLAPDQSLGAPINHPPLEGVRFDDCVAACKARTSLPCVAVIALRLSGAASADVSQGTFDCQLMQGAPEPGGNQITFVFPSERLYVASNTPVDCSTTASCPQDCTGMWLVGACSKQCGPGERNLTFKITTPASNGGGQCVADGQTVVLDCNEAPCPIDCVGDWSTVGATCSMTCGPGSITATWNVTIEAQFGGKECPHAAGTTKQQDCNEGDCPWPPVVIVPCGTLPPAGTNAAWPGLCSTAVAVATCTGTCTGGSSGTAPVASCNALGVWSVTTNASCQPPSFSLSSTTIAATSGTALSLPSFVICVDANDAGQTISGVNVSCEAGVTFSSAPSLTLSSAQYDLAFTASSSGTTNCNVTATDDGAGTSGGTGSSMQSFTITASLPVVIVPCGTLPPAGTNAAWPGLCSTAVAVATCTGTCTGGSSGTAPVASCNALGVWSVTTNASCQPPSFSLSSTTIAATSGTALSLPRFVICVDANDAGQTISGVNVSCEAGVTFSSAPSLTLSSAQYDLAFTASSSGTTNCNVTATDDGAGTSGGTGSSMQSFTITASLPVNTQPSFFLSTSSVSIIQGVSTTISAFVYARTPNDPGQTFPTANITTACNTHSEYTNFITVTCESTTSTTCNVTFYAGLVSSPGTANCIIRMFDDGVGTAGGPLGRSRLFTLTAAV